MNADNVEFNPIDTYLTLLKSLSPDSQLELISRLSASLRGSRESVGQSLSSLYGSFISKRSADEIISDLKNSRSFNRKTEEL
jgi:hypothetical protein